MTAFFGKIKNWIVGHLPTKRRLIQIYTALLYNANIKGYISGDIFKGNSKYVCAPGLNCYSCPGAVAACPLGALQNAFASSGNSSAYYIFGILGIFGVMFGRTVCGFFCPVGLGQELLYKVRTPKLAKSRATRILSYLKYVILVMMVIAIPIMYSAQSIAVPAFCKYICPAGTLGGGIGLLINPVNQQGSGNLLAMLGGIFTWKFALLIVFLVASVFIYRPFCRFFCPLGAIYGFFNKFALFGIKVNEDKCTHCGLCVQHCKMDVKCVGDHECINCGECKAVCPAGAIGWKCAKLFGQENADAKVSVSTPIPCEAGTAQEGHSVFLTRDASESATDNSIRSSDIQGSPLMTSGDAVGKKRTKGFAIQLTAWILALSLLVGVALYCNVFAESSSGSIEVGSVAPDFSLRIYGTDEKNAYTLLEDRFVLSEHSGEVTVVNFWATWCGPCVEEIPGFNEIAKEFPQVNVLGVQGLADRDVARFISGRDRDGYEDRESWRDYTMIFLQDELDGNDCLTYIAFGGRSTWPMTVIVGKDGKIAFIRNGKLSESELREQVERALNA